MGGAIAPRRQGLPRNPIGRSQSQMAINKSGHATQKSLRWLPGGGTTMHRYLGLGLRLRRSGAALPLDPERSGDGDRGGDTRRA